MPRLWLALIAAGMVPLCALTRGRSWGDDSATEAPAAAPKTEEMTEGEIRALKPEERAKRLEIAVRELSIRLGSLRTLRTKFKQTKHLDVFDEDVVSQGSLALALTSPSRMRWEYTSPVRSVLIVNGDRARRERTTRKGDKSATTFALADDPVAAATAEQVFIWTRGDFEKGRRSYDFELISEKPLTIRATPSDDRLAKVLASVDLRFSDDRKALVEVALSERSKARTRIEFSDIQRDPNLPDELFKVED